MEEQAIRDKIEFEEKERCSTTQSRLLIMSQLVLAMICAAGRKRSPKLRLRKPKARITVMSGARRRLAKRPIKGSW